MTVKFIFYTFALAIALFLAYAVYMLADAYSRGAI